MKDGIVILATTSAKEKYENTKIKRKIKKISCPSCEIKQDKLNNKEQKV